MMTELFLLEIIICIQKISPVLLLYPPPPQTYPTPQLAAVSPPPNRGGEAGWDSSGKLQNTVNRGLS